MIQVKNLTKHFPVDANIFSRLLNREQYIHAIEQVDLEIERGQIYGLAGESGCGKSTLAYCIAGLHERTGGDISIADEHGDLNSIDQSRIDFRKEVQIIFQDPYESINDRFTVREWVKEPLKIQDIGDNETRDGMVIETLEQCELKPASKYTNKYPHELSGGERQRISIARAMILNPSVLIADEPTSMLDVSVRAGILKLFKNLRDEEGITILMISHDLSILRYICDSIAIMYQGEIVEAGDADLVLGNPKHPYTQILLKAVPNVDPRISRERIEIPPDVKERLGGIQGCAFKHRCPYRFEECDVNPDQIDVGHAGNQAVRCHLYDRTIDEDLPNFDP